MNELLIGIQRRVLTSVLSFAAAKLGLDMAETTIQTTVIAVMGAVGVLGPLWSYFQKIEGRDLQRRLVSGSMLLLYTLLGVLDLGLSDPERAQTATALSDLLKTVLGEPSPEVLAMTGTAGAMAISSKLLPRKRAVPTGALRPRNQ